VHKAVETEIKEPFENFQKSQSKLLHEIMTSSAYIMMSFIMYKKDTDIIKMVLKLTPE